MKTKNKLLVSLTAFLLCALLAFVCILCTAKKGTAVVINERSIVLTDKIEKDSVLSKYDDASFEVCGTAGTFTGCQSLDASVLSELDYISANDIEALEDCKVKYKYTYDVETNIVTLSAEMHNELGEIEMDELSGIAFINENGQIDAVINLEDNESILLSEMAQAGMIDNVGWLSRLFRAVVIAATVAVAAVITVCTAGTGAVATVAAVTAVVSATAYVVAENVQANENYKNNVKLDGTVNGLINGQSAFSNWKFGVRTMDYNGCGVIATYNIMYLLGKPQKLSQVAYDIERKQGALAWGYAGTDPTHPYEYFKEKGIAAKQYSNFNSFNTALNNMRYDQYALVCYINDKNDLGLGAHYVAVSRKGSGFEIYNHSNKNQNPKTEYSLTNIMNLGKGSLIAGLIVN